MKNYDFDWQINEFMIYCRSTQLRERTMYSYEQTLRLFERWCSDELKIYSVDKVTENVIRRYISDLQERGKYTFYVNDLSKAKNYPDRRRDSGFSFCLLGILGDWNGNFYYFWLIGIGKILFIYPLICWLLIYIYFSIPRRFRITVTGTGGAAGRIVFYVLCSGARRKQTTPGHGDFVEIISISMILDKVPLIQKDLKLIPVGRPGDSDFLPCIRRGQGKVEAVRIGSKIEVQPQAMRPQISGSGLPVFIFNSQKV